MKNFQPLDPFFSTWSTKSNGTSAVPLCWPRELMLNLAICFAALKSRKRTNFRSKLADDNDIYHFLVLRNPLHSIKPSLCVLDAVVGQLDNTREKYLMACKKCVSLLFPPSDDTILRRFLKHFQEAKAWFKPKNHKNVKLKYIQMKVSNFTLYFR